MGLITVALLAALGLLLCGGAIKNKPPFLEKLIAQIKTQTDNLGLWGVVYGLVALFLTVVGTSDQVTLALRLLGNALIVVMALTIGFDRIMGFFPKFNPAVRDEFRTVVNKIAANGTWIGFAALGLAGVMFLKIFS